MNPTPGRYTEVDAGEMKCDNATDDRERNVDQHQPGIFHVAQQNEE